MLSNMFKSKQPQPEAPAEPPKEAQPQGNLEPEAPAANPLDAYAKLWDNTPTDEDVAPTLDIPDDAISEVTKGLNFFEGVDPELVQQAQSGDSESLLALIQASNANAYKLAMQHSAAVVNDHVGRTNAYVEGKLPSKLTSALTSNVLAETTPQFDNPVVKNEFNRMASKIQAKNPNASPAWVAAQTQDYFRVLADAANPKPQTPASQPTEIDWSTYLSEG